MLGRKTYEFSWSGYYEMQHDIKQRKINRISKVTTLLLLVCLVSFGSMPISFAGFIAGNMAIGSILDFLL